jgi:hypothetical protein
MQWIDDVMGQQEESYHYGSGLEKANDLLRLGNRRFRPIAHQSRNAVIATRNQLKKNATIKCSSLYFVYFDLTQ